VHMAYDAKLGGPVQYRWMYPFERFMGDSKRAIKNRARVEISICVVYVHKETSYFFSHYFIDHVHVQTTTRNDVENERDSMTLSVFNLPGRHSGKTRDGRSERVPISSCSCSTRTGRRKRGGLHSHWWVVA